MRHVLRLLGLKLVVLDCFAVQWPNRWPRFVFSVSRSAVARTQTPLCVHGFGVQQTRETRAGGFTFEEQ